MKKINKILFLSLFLLLFTGCQSDYGIVIKKDFKVIETIGAYETQEMLSTFGFGTPLQAIYQIKSAYSDYDELYKSGVRTSDSEKMGVLARRVYKNIDEYVNGTPFPKRVFGKLETTKNGNLITLSTSGELYYFFDNELESSAIKNLKIEITPEFKVINSNADIVKDNTYTWIMNEAVGSKNITLTFDATKRIESINIGSFYLEYWQLILLIIGLVIVAFLGFVGYKIYIGNKFD